MNRKGKKKLTGLNEVSLVKTEHLSRNMIFEISFLTNVNILQHENRSHSWV